MAKKSRGFADPESEAPPWEVLQERILAVLNEYADENPVVPDALLLTGAGLAYVTFATTRYGPEAFQNVYENLRSIVQLFQLIIDDERKHLPKRSLKDATKKKALKREMGGSGISPQEVDRHGRTRDKTPSGTEF